MVITHALPDVVLDAAIVFTFRSDGVVVKILEAVVVVGFDAAAVREGVPLINAHCVRRSVLTIGQSCSYRSWAYRRRGSTVVIYYGVANPPVADR